MTKLANQILTLKEEGDNAIRNQQIKPQIVLFVGMTAAGKSTLINYLNSVQLESFRDEAGIYRLKAKDPANELPGIKIGHSSTVSCTRHPHSYSPPEEKFTYVDLPGFGDSGNLINEKKELAKTNQAAQDIANAYFRKAISDKADEFKLVLVVAYSDLTSAAGNLPKCLEDLSYFIQSIESSDPVLIEKIKNALTIVVTKVEDKHNKKKLDIEKIDECIAMLRRCLAQSEQKNEISGINDLRSYIAKEEQQRAILSNDMPPPLEEAIERTLINFITGSPFLQDTKNVNMKKILNNIVSEKRFAVFSNPFQTGDKSFDEANKILQLIHKMTFLPKEDAGINIYVSSNHFKEVLKALDSTEIIGQKLAEHINLDLSVKLKSAFIKGDWAEVEKIRNSCKVIKDYRAERRLEEFFDYVHNELKLSEETTKQYREFNRFLSLLVNLLPEEDQRKYTKIKNWIKALELAPILDRRIDDATNLLREPTVFQEPAKNSPKKIKLTVQGYNIKTSQIDAIIQEHSNLQNIEVHALHTIIIDNDLANSNPKCANKLYGVNLLMIAPNVTVSGDRTIDLSGEGGGNYTEAAASASGYDVHGNGLSGTAGAPGKPGASAGNFFMATDNLVNGQRLTLLLDGGKGGTGQQGGNGYKGKDGSAWDPNNMSSGWFLIEKRHEIGGRTSLAGHKHDGERGKNGGRAGDGGAGGKGGNKGESIIISLSGHLLNDAVTLKKPKDGDRGDPGHAGNPGPGGANGADAYRTYRWFHNGEKWDDDQHNKSNGGTGLSGAFGQEGTNTKGIKDPDVILSNPGLCLLNYKIFSSLEAIKHPEILGNYLQVLQQSLENIKAIILQTTTLNLLQEANVLEIYSTQYGRTLDFTLFYHSLLARIKEFASNTARTAAEKKVLEYLYVATLGSLARLNAEADNLLIIDIHNYVKNLVKNDLQQLSKMNAASLKEYYRNQYQSNIENKIQEAQEFLGMLKGDIDKRQNEIEPQILKLKEEVNQARKKGSSELILLQQKRQELEAALCKKSIFGAISLAVQAVGMAIPPAGPVVATVVNAGIEMAMTPSFEAAMNFGGKIFEMQSHLKEFSSHVSQNPHPLKHEADLLKKIGNMVKTAAPLLQDIKALLSQKAEGEARLNELDDHINQVNAYISELNGYLEKIPSALGSYLEEVVHEVKDFQQALQDKSLAALEFSKLEIKRFFNSLKHNLKVLVGNFDAKEGFLEIANKMEEAIEVSAHIYAHVQDHRDHIAFANFIAHLETADVQKIEVSAEYQKEIDELNKRLHRNIVQQAYYRAIAAAKQWAFPFAEKFLGTIGNFEAINDADMQKNLTGILRRLNEYRDCITSMDQAIISSHFTNNTPSFQPFSTWSYEEYPKKIEALLKGEKVILKADPRQINLNAVKFNSITLKWECQLSPKQQELDAALKGSFQVSLEHSGISYYRYDNHVYRITIDKPIEIKHSFHESANGMPTEHSIVSEKISVGDIVLSPYTAWVVQISQLPTAKNHISLFNQFKNDMPRFRVSLVGQGNYVDLSRVNGNLQLAKYYESADMETSTYANGPRFFNKMQEKKADPATQNAAPLRNRPS